MKTAISKQLKKLGVPTNLLGYDYLKEAIELVIKDKEYLRCVVKKLYREIASLYSSTPQRVERAMRHAIHSAFARGDIKTWEIVFLNIGNKPPTNSEFVACVADYLKGGEPDA